jgi:predicted cupin superfamily sugar epimerase
MDQSINNNNIAGEIQQLIQNFGLIPHPEGGFYKETYRSDIAFGHRKLITAIYFLLTSENVSNFHRIKSDELWFHHAGSPLVVHTLTEAGHQENVVGNPLIPNMNSQFLVEKDTVFGSTVLEADSYSFVSCVVAPGFDFNDFELFTAKELLMKYPNEEHIIGRLTIE